MIYLEGTISCKAAIESGRHQKSILYTDEKKRTRDFSWIIRQARKAGIPVIPCTRARLDEMTGSHTHGGMVLETEPSQFETLDAHTFDTITGYLCYLDGIEDPYNLGSVCRTLYAAGCSLLILPYRDWTASFTILMRASAGTLEKLKIVTFEDEHDLVHALKEHKIPILCAHRKDAIPLFGYRFPETFCLALGGAMRGLNRTITDASSQNIYIPYATDMRAALDTPSAAAVFSFAWTGEQYQLPTACELKL